MRGKRSEPLRSDAEAQAIALAHLNLSRHAVRRWHRTHDPDDIRQECYFALFRAAQTWDPARSSFATWSRGYLQTQMRHLPNREGLTCDQVRRRLDAGAALPHLLSTEDRVREGSTATRGERLPDPVDALGDALLTRDLALLREDLRDLADRYADNPGARAAIAYLTTDLSAEDCAERQGVSRAYVTKWVDRLANDYHHAAARLRAEARHHHRRAA